MRCGICFDDVPRIATLAARCGHPYCKECWGGYVQAAISGGRPSLDLRCPLPECCAAVPRSVVLSVASPADAARYDTFAVRSYVDYNRRAAWCPGAGCEAAAEATVDVGGDALDVACSRCGEDFCFTCGRDAHRPVDCDTVKKWMTKNSAESENLNWILAHTKACPKCKRPIEKNQGCMHMTCSQCRHNFCWLCEAPWSDHGERTGGFYACNRYETQRKAGAYDDVAAQRERARTALERYTHYYQRWAEHDRARTRAAAQAVAAAGAKLDALADATATPPSQLRFVLDAWSQVVQCRRILKWTYAYGYYRFAEVGGGEDPAAASGSDGAPPPPPRPSPAEAAALRAQQDFFEYAQGQAETYLEMLHAAVEKKLDALLNDGESDEDGEEGGGGGDPAAGDPAAAAPPAYGAPDAAPAADGADVAMREASGTPRARPPPGWAEFREHLIGLTDVTRTHFDRLVAELERGLDNLAAEYHAGDAFGEGDGSQPSARRVVRPPSRGPTLLGGCGTSGAATAGRATWQCTECTFANDAGATACTVCEHPREGG